MSSGKLIIFSAPSGAGKSTLVHYLLSCKFDLEFSISATSRLPRGEEIDGKDYYFLSIDRFKELIDNKEFIEYEEVYAGCFYGTLRSEIDRITSLNKNVIFDVDVIGGLNIKNIYKERALALFISPPSINILHERLISRGTDSEEQIKKRIAKADLEMQYASKFDYVIVNDDLEKAKDEVIQLISSFLDK